MGTSTLLGVPTWLSGYIPLSFAGELSFWAFFIVVSLVLGLYLGRSQLVNIVLYTYISTAILNVLPSSLFNFSEPYGKLIVFLAMLLFMFFMSDYLFDIHISSASSDFFWRILMTSFLAVGMLLSIIFSLVPQSIAHEYVSFGTLGYFTGQWAQVVWLLFPLLFLLFVNKRLN